MKKVLRRRPSASMLVATTALVIAASGTAIAAGGLVNGDSLIMKQSLSGNRLRNHTITGTQVNVNKLGKVQSAKNADHATTAITANTAGSATNATNATNAVNAVNATNATNLGGQPASNYLTAASRIGTNGYVKASGTPGGNTVPLFTVGPFTVTMTCTKTGAGTSAVINAKSTEDKSVLNGLLVPTAGATTNLGTGNTSVNVPQTTGFSDTTTDAVIDFEAPSGAQALLQAADGVNSLNADCWANWAGIR
jgi:hypothetical protein